MDSIKVRQAQKTEWKDFLNTQEIFPLFYSWDWKELMETAVPWLKAEYFVFEKNKTVIAIMSGFTYKNTFQSMPYCEYGGLLCNKIKNSVSKEELYKLFLKELKQNNYVIKANFDEEKNLEVFPFAEKLIVTYLNNISNSEEKLMSSFRKTTRHSIRYAKENGVEIKNLSSEKELKLFYDLQISTIRKNRGIAMPFKILKGVFELQKKGKAVILVSYLNNKMLSGIVVLFGKKYASYYMSANSKESYKSHANHLLVWQAILESKKKNLKYFDFGAAVKGTPAEVFKKGWGGEFREITEYSNKKPIIPGFDSLPRKILGVIPSFLMKLSSKKLAKLAFEKL